jgi:hypothetical protein
MPSASKAAIRSGSIASISGSVIGEHEHPGPRLVHTWPRMHAPGGIPLRTSTLAMLAICPAQGWFRLVIVERPQQDSNLRIRLRRT